MFGLLSEPVRASSFARAEAETCYLPNSGNLFSVAGLTCYPSPTSSFVCCRTLFSLLVVVVFVVTVELVGVTKSVVCHSHVLQLAPGAFRQAAVFLALHVIVQHPLWFIHWYLVHHCFTVRRVT